MQQSKDILFIDLQNLRKSRRDVNVQIINSSSMEKRISVNLL